VHNKNAFVKAMMHINDESSKHPPPPGNKRPAAFYCESEFGVWRWENVCIRLILLRFNKGTQEKFLKITLFCVLLLYVCTIFYQQDMVVKSP